MVSTSPPNTAATFCAIAIARYHMPNIKANIRAGTNLETYDNPTGDINNSPKVWNKYVNTKNAIEILTPSEIPIAPKPRTRNPIATKINPKPYLKAAEGLYLDSHNLETVDASAMMKKEFNVENQETVISDTSLENSFFSIHNAAPQ